MYTHKVLNNNSPNYLAQLFISHQSHYTSSRNNLYVPRPRLDLPILRWSIPHSAELFVTFSAELTDGMEPNSVLDFVPGYVCTFLNL